MIGIDDVFEARIASGGSTASARRKMSSLTSASSTTASIIRSAGTRSSTALDARQHLVGRTAPPFSSSFAEALPHRLERASVAPGLRVVQRHAAAGGRDDLRDAAAHLPRADDENVFEVHVASVTPLRSTATSDEESERQQQDQRQEEQVPTGKDVDEHGDRKSGKQQNDGQGHGRGVTAGGRL